MRVLVADDQQGVLDAAHFLLKAEGHSAVTADSPQSVLRLTAKDEFDLILMDLNYARDTTSGQEGLDLLAALRSAGVRTPVVVMTAWGSVDLAVEAMRRGASDFVQKPWDNTRLLETIEKQVAKARSARSDLDIAREVQAKLLPRTGPKISGLEYAGRCVPARGVGGDYFDWFDLGSGQIGFVLADVSGKGIGAALLMANLHGALRTLLSVGFSGGPQLVEAVNRQFWESSPPEQYATLLFARFDPRFCRLSYVNAGHAPGMVLHSDGSRETLEPTGMPVGLFANSNPGEQSVDLQPGDVVLLYSDGVVEAGMSGRGEDFGEERLAASLQSVQLSSAAEVVSRICERVAAWDSDQHDDYTVLALRCVA
ncbi:MAG: SpoIIE family protein phosphatase [Bryobacteraceae bacterium]|nr:SpoIIE family protein phosphatase [Bryobacteraceae bacterium]